MNKTSPQPFDYDLDSHAAEADFDPDLRDAQYDNDNDDDGPRSEEDDWEGVDDDDDDKTGVNTRDSAETCSRRSILIEPHRQHLKASGLTDETIEQLGFCSCDTYVARKLLRWPEEMSGDPAGLAIPYPEEPEYVKVRPDSPRRRQKGSAWEKSRSSVAEHDYSRHDDNGGGDVVKYEAPIGEPARWYIPRRAFPKISDHEERLYIVEGEKKTALMNQEGNATIGAPGVSTTHDMEHRRYAEDRGLHAFRLPTEVRWFITKGREVTILFDTPDMEENANVIMAAVRLAKMVHEEGAVPLVGYVPLVPGLTKVGPDDYYVAEIAAGRGRVGSPVGHDFGARPVHPNEQLDWLVEERDEYGWDAASLRPALRQCAIWTYFWHERKAKPFKNWCRQAEKKLRCVSTDEIEKHVAHFTQSRRGEKLRNFSDTEIVERCVPVLDEHFAMLRDPDGTERLYAVNKRNEVTLLQETTGMTQVLHDSLKETFGEIPPSDLLGRAIRIWRLEGRPMEREPEPFCFAGDERLCFKRFGWLPTQGEHPAWSEFLSRLSDPEIVMAFFWSLFEPRNEGRQILWLRGDGQDGKSKVLGVLMKVFGPAAIGINNTHVKHQSQFLTSMVYGKRLVIYPDSKNAKFVMSEIVRNWTSGDSVPVEFKGKTPFSVPMRVKLIVASNAKPEITGQRADLSRLLHVEVAESKMKDDPTWGNRLEDELPAFLFACRDAYTRLCPNHGDLRVDDSMKHRLDDAVASCEERFHDAFEELFLPAAGDKVAAFLVSAALHAHGFDNNLMKDFKEWLLREKGVNYRRSNDGRWYDGMRRRNTRPT